MGVVAVRTGLLITTVVALISTSCGTPAADHPTGSRGSGFASGSAAAVHPSPAPDSRCAEQAQVHALPGAPVSLGLDARGASAPVWSARVGSAEVADGGSLFSASGTGCVVAVQGGSGRQTWSWAVPRFSTVMGLAAGPQIVLAATGASRGHAPAMVYSATDQLTGLDPRAGTQRWSLHLADDGQGVPAVIADGRVIVAESNGTVIGLDAVTGVRRWLDPVLRGCAARDVQNGLSPAAAMMPTSASNVIVVYQCPYGSRLVRVNPASGAAQWTRTLPAGWSVAYQSPAGGSAGVIGLLAQGRGAAIAPLKAGTPESPTGYETESVLALSATTGRPPWQLDDVATSAGVYGGGGQLCVVSGFGAACYSADTGARSWQWTPPVTPSDGGPAGSDFTAVATHAGQLYLAVPTPAAKSIPTGSTTFHPPSDSFELRAIDMGSGRTLTVTPLPAFYGGQQQVVVSADSPPGVLAVGNGDVLVSPQLHETDVVEAFALH